ncbi:MAG: thioredoxin family protein [Acidobacteriota bacterium]
MKLKLEYRMFCRRALMILVLGTFYSAAAVCVLAQNGGQTIHDAPERGILEPVTTKKDLYPADAKPKEEIERALKAAAELKKRVMLIFGANWCYDCHVLDRALHEGAAGKIVEKNFLLIHVDIGDGEKNPDLLKLYKIPLAKGVPAVAILTGEGKLIYSSGDGEFEAARSMMKKDLVAFLRRWKDTPQ